MSAADRSQMLPSRRVRHQRCLPALILPPAEPPAEGVAVQVLQLLYDASDVDAAMNSQELDDLIGQKLLGVSVISLDLELDDEPSKQLSLVAARHGPIRREDIPDLTLPLFGEAALEILSHVFLSGSPSSLMACDGFRRIRVYDSKFIALCQYQNLAAKILMGKALVLLSFILLNLLTFLMIRDIMVAEVR